jgi:hypothetical protein
MEYGRVEVVVVWGAVEVVVGRVVLVVEESATCPGAHDTRVTTAPNAAIHLINNQTTETSNSFTG